MWNYLKKVMRKVHHGKGRTKEMGKGDNIGSVRKVKVKGMS